MDFFRRNEKKIIWITVLIIVPVFGIGTLLTSLSSGSDSSSFGTIDGTTLTRDMLIEFMNRHGINSKAPVDAIVARYIELEKARRSGFGVSDAQVADMVKESGMFKGENDQFSITKFNEFLQDRGTTEAKFMAGLREQLLMQKLDARGDNIMHQPVPVSNDEILYRYHKDNDKYKVKYAMIPVEKLDKEEQPQYEEVEAIYNQAQTLRQEELEGDDAFSADFPIMKELVKEWIIVEYLAVSKRQIISKLDLDPSAIITHYEKNKEELYRAEEKPAEATPTEEAPAADEAPKFKPLDDTLKKSIERSLIEKEAERLAVIMRDEIKDRKIKAEARGEMISLKELARLSYNGVLVPSEDFALDGSDVIVSNLSDPVELPQNLYTPITIDRTIGGIRPDYSSLYGQGPKTRSDWDRAKAAIDQPDANIATQFLEAQNGYVMFVPVWWPNQDVQQGHPDFKYIIPFPKPDQVGIVKADKEEKEEIEKSLLDLKIENATLNSSIALYQRIKRLLADKKARDIAKTKAEALHPQLTVEKFDELVKKEGYELKTEPLMNLASGGDAVEACYLLEPNSRTSEVFFSAKGKKFFGIGVLLATEIPEDSAIPQEEVEKLRKSIVSEKQRDYRTITSIVGQLDWDRD